MKIKITEIGLIHQFAWLVIEEGDVRTSIKLTPSQLSDFAQTAIFRLKEHSRTQREFCRGLETELSRSNVESSTDGK